MRIRKVHNDIRTMSQCSATYCLAWFVSTATFLFPTTLLAQDESLLPRQYFQKYLEQQQKAAEENKSSNARRYWIDIAEQVKNRRRGLTGKQDSEISWQLSETRDRLTQSRTLTSTAVVEDGGNQLRVEFTCSSFKKQLQMLLTDISPSTNGIPDTSQNLANISMVFNPPALDAKRNQIRNAKMPFNGKTIVATGLNSNSWGISLCGEDAGGAGYVFNAAYCSATGLKNGPRDIKDWDWIRYPWLDFDEVRMSMQIDWGARPSDGKQVQTNHFLAIAPYAPGLKETLAECDRDENFCLAISDSSQARSCSEDLRRQIR